MARQLRHEEGIYDEPEQPRARNTARKPIPPPLVPTGTASARGGGLRIIDDDEELARAEEDESGEVHHWPIGAAVPGLAGYLKRYLNKG